MADAEETPENEETEEKKGGTGKIIILAVVGMVAVGGAGAGGAIAGSKFLGAPAAAAEPAEPEPPPEEPRNSTRFTPIVVDVRDQDGAMHHLKVGLSAEFPQTVTEDEFTKFMPRGREAAITYLRAQKYEDVTQPKKFEKLREGLEKRIIEAIGESRILRVVVTDFVAQ